MTTATFPFTRPSTWRGGWKARGARFEELVIPNEVHGFLRYRSWLEADTATVGFLERELAASP